MLPLGACPSTIVRCCYRATCISLCTVAVGLLSGCGNVLYTYRANSASSRIEEAKAAGAEKTATYEFTLAQEHLRKSMSEASEADYGDATELAGLASEYAQQAIDKAKYRTTKEEQ